MADSIELRASVTCIKKVDPYVKDLIATATQVALYKFNLATNEWEKTDKEGALFLYSRNGEPYNSLMVLNRLNKDNFIEPIVKDFDYQMQVPFLLYRNSKNKIFGIWFFNREECIRIAFLIDSIMEGKDRSDDKPGPRRILDKRQNGRDSGTDIFSMLSRAQEDFNKTPTKQDTTFPPTFSSTPRVPDVTSQSVMDFFAKAGSSTKTKSTKQPLVSAGNGANVLQRLMSNPAHSVEHIEKQQRSITPQEQIRYGKSAPTSSSDRRSVPIVFSGGSGPVEQKEPTTIKFRMSNSPPNQVQHSTTSRVLPTAVTSPSPLAFLMQNNNMKKSESNAVQPESQAEVLGTSPFAQFLEKAQKPQLMTPKMFIAGIGESLASREKQMTEPKEVPSTTTKFDDRQSSDSVEMLTEKQLAQALIYMLKNNTEFTKQIHEAYVNSILERVNIGSSPSGLSGSR